MTILYITLAYFICGISTAIKDLRMPYINAPTWTYRPTIQLFSIVILTWFFRPFFISENKNNPLRNRRIAFGFFASFIELALMTFLIWISSKLASYVTDSEIVRLIVAVFLFFIITLFITPFLTIPMALSMLVLAWPLELLFPLPNTAKNLRWCRNCLYYKKSKEYEDTVNGLWQSSAVPENNKLPCRIPLETVETWKAYFSLGTENRTLFPKECLKFKHIN